jgi:hypothetical protein
MTEPKIDYAALAEKAVAEGATPTPPGTLYFTFKRTDGDTFVAPAANAEGYLRKGYTIEGELTIEGIAAWNDANAAAATPAPAATKTTAKAPNQTTAASSTAA